MIQRFMMWLVMRFIVRRVGFHMELNMGIIAKIILMRMMGVVDIMLDLVFVMIENVLNGFMMRCLVMELKITMKLLFKVRR